jgi:hypothetical protein
MTKEDLLIELKEEIRKLHILLNENETGLFTWAMFVKEQAGKINVLFIKLGLIKI